MVLDSFNNNYGVIDHEANREDQTEKRERIHGEPEHREYRECADQRHRYCEQRNKRRAPALKKNEHDNDDENERFDERYSDFLNALSDGERCIESNDIIEVRRKFFR